LDAEIVASARVVPKIIVDRLIAVVAQLAAAHGHPTLEPTVAELHVLAVLVVLARRGFRRRL
jgi:hypothetical protein